MVSLKKVEKEEEEKTPQHKQKQISGFEAPITRFILFCYFAFAWHTSESISTN